MSDPVADLMEKITKGNERERTEAWFHAGEVGAGAVRPLAEAMVHPDPEVARAARRGLWQIVRAAGKPTVAEERQRASAELIPLLAAERPQPIRREALWMLSEVGGEEAVDPVSALLEDEQLREDARCALERIPGERSLAALRAGLAKAPEDFKPNLAQSLRARGVETPGVPCRKMVPTKPTAVKPTG